MAKGFKLISLVTFNALVGTAGVCVCVREGRDHLGQGHGVCFYSLKSVKLLSGFTESAELRSLYLTVRERNTFSRDVCVLFLLLTAFSCF